MVGRLGLEFRCWVPSLFFSCYYLDMQRRSYKHIVFLIFILLGVFIYLVRSQKVTFPKFFKSFFPPSSVIDSTPKESQVNWEIPDLPTIPTEYFWSDIPLSEENGWLRKVTFKKIDKTAKDPESEILVGGDIFEHVEEDVINSEAALMPSIVTSFWKDLEDSGWHAGNLQYETFEIRGVDLVSPSTQALSFVKILSDEARVITIYFASFGVDGNYYSYGSKCPCQREILVFISDPIDLTSAHFN